MELSLAVASCLGFAAGATFALLATHDREYYSLILKLRKIQRRCHRRKQEAKQHKLKVALVTQVGPVGSAGQSDDTSSTPPPPSASELEAGINVATVALLAAFSAGCPTDDAILAFNGQTLAALRDPNGTGSNGSGPGAGTVDCGPLESFLHDVERASLYSAPDSLPSLCSSDTESDIETPSPIAGTGRPLFLQIWDQPGLPEPEP